MEQTVIQKQRIKLKLIQKLQLHLFQGKIKQVIQFGQIIIQGNQVQSGVIKLIDPSVHWLSSKAMNKRISPNSLPIIQVSASQYSFRTCVDYKSKPIIDYIIRKQTFTPQKIPLLFVYTMQVSSSNIEFIFKYKINQKWKEPLLDIQICVCLNQQFMVTGDCKTIPMAVSLRNSKIIWKTKEISHQAAAKGKILLAFTNSNVSPKKIIKQIRLSMKCLNKGIIDGLNAQCLNQDSYKSHAEKSVLISYKVLPNE